MRWTDDLYSWHDVARTPENARSIASLDGRIYLGGADATIYAGPMLP